VNASEGHQLQGVFWERDGSPFTTRITTTQESLRHDFQILEDAVLTLGERRSLSQDNRCRSRARPIVENPLRLMSELDTASTTFIAYLQSKKKRNREMHSG